MQYKIQSTPKKIPFILFLCGQIGVAVLRSKIPNHQVFPQNKIHKIHSAKLFWKILSQTLKKKQHTASKIILEILFPKLWRKNPQQNYFEKSYARIYAQNPEVKILPP